MSSVEYSESLEAVRSIRARWHGVITVADIAGARIRLFEDRILRDRIAQSLELTRIANELEAALAPVRPLAEAAFALDMMKRDPWQQPR